MLIKLLKRIFATTPTRVYDPRARAAMSHIVINEDGSKSEFLFGTVSYGKGCEPPGGHKPVTTIESKNASVAPKYGEHNMRVVKFVQDPATLERMKEIYADVDPAEMLARTA